MLTVNIIAAYPQPLSRAYVLRICEAVFGLKLVYFVVRPFYIQRIGGRLLIFKSCSDGEPVIAVMLYFTFVAVYIGNFNKV